MGPFQIAFIAVNLILPTWLYFRTDTTSKVEWKILEKNIGRLIDSGGGANCETDKISDKVIELCKKAVRKQDNSEIIVFEQDIGDHTYACEARQNSISLTIHRAEVADPDRACILNDPHNTIAQSPGFVFTMKGFVNSMSFMGDDGDRQTVGVKSCRRKLKAAKSLNYSNAQELEAALPISPNDPSDVKLANRFCWVYDAAPAWAEVRQRCLGKSE